jgi:predicted MPP superfamily phosphohydrolase
LGSRWLLAGRLIDLVALSSALVAPAGLLLAIHGLASGSAGRAALGLAIAVAAAPGAHARYAAPFHLRVTRLALGLAGGGRPLRVCFFSDLHTGRFKRASWVRKVVALANAQSADAILIGGDFIDDLDGQALPDLLHPLRDLRAPLGVWAILGNHDYGLPGENKAAELEALLPRYGIRVLKNERVALGEHTQLVALGELWAGVDDVEKAFAGRDPARRAIVLGHNPDLMGKIDQPAAVFLFGHTHAGQIYLPFLPGLGVPVKSTLYRGLHRLPQGPVYVSSGVGESTTPTRLGTRPEIVVVEM